MLRAAYLMAALLALGTFGPGAAFAAPSDIPRDAGIAAGALLRGDAQEAVTRYTEALKESSLSNDRRASILTDRGVAYIKLSQPRLAIEDFNMAAQLFPEFAPVYNNRGNLLLSLGVVKEAMKDFDRAIVLAPGYAAAYNNRAGGWVRLGKLEDAVRDYSKAIELMPQNPAPLSGRGRAHFAERRPYAAIRDFSRSVVADARFAAGYRNRAEAKLMIERYDEAIEDLSRAIAFDVNHAESYFVRGEAYLATRNVASAIKDFTEAITINGKFAEAYAARGLAHGMAEAYDEAYGDLNKAIELEPRSGLAFAYRAYMYKQTGQLDVAERDLEVALKLNPESPEVLWADAELKEAQGKTETAIANLKKAVDLKPGYRDAIDSLVRLGARQADDGEGSEIVGAGIDGWRVVMRQGWPVAVSDLYPRVSVPLEMLGKGDLKLLSWQIKEPPYGAFGELIYSGGQVMGRDGPEEIEIAAIIDIEMQTLVAVEPHKQGAKVSTWTWQPGKVTVAAIDGVTDEFLLRPTAAQSAALAAGGRIGPGGTAASNWAPWEQPWAGGAPPPTKKATAKKKYKSFFELLFN